MRIRTASVSRLGIRLSGWAALLGVLGCSGAKDQNGGEAQGAAGAGFGPPAGYGGAAGGVAYGGSFSGGGYPSGSGGASSGAAPSYGGSGGPGGATSVGGSLGAGGAVPPGGATGAGGGGVAAGGSGNPTLAHCDMTTESSAAPITSACGDITTPTGDTVQLGPLGAMMDVNVGAGFENKDPADTATCPAFVGLFNENPKISQQLLDTGTQPCNATAPNTGSCLDFKLYSVYRPATWPAGQIPVLSWGNGTCAQPEGYGTLLRYVASYGFFVVAANSRETGSGAEIKHAIDFAAAANGDPSSPYYGHLDLSKVGVMGHSQGSAGAAAAASDARVQSVILFNAGDTAVKPYLAISGDLDITGYTASAMATAINGQPKAAYLYYHNPAGNTADGLRGHLVLMLTPERVAPATVGFWQMMLQNDATAKTLFDGPSCGLCGHSSDYDYGQHGL